MSTLQFVLIGLIVLAIAAMLWFRRRWLGIALAAAFFAIQVMVVAVGFDAELRAVGQTEARSGRAIEQFARAINRIKEVQLPLRISILLSGSGLLLVAILGGLPGQRGTRRSPEDS